MGKYGTKKFVNSDPLSYNIGLIGESGIGKSTLMKEVCERLVGENGYIALNIGKEDGHDAIQGIISEDIPDYTKWADFVNDVTTNKRTDYPELRVVVLDTIDQLFEVVEPEVIRMHNAMYSNNRDKQVSSIKAAFGGFMAGEDKVIEIVLNDLWRLKRVGISFIAIGHTKKRDIEDVVTGQTYATLTTNISQRYFNALKTKLHILGVASIDREIVKERTGKQNPVTKKEILKGHVVAESRKVTFRDDNYNIDSKSRFAQIVDSIPLDADAFIKALNDAIQAAQKDMSPEEKNLITTISDIATKSGQLIESGVSRSAIASAIKEVCGMSNFNKITDVGVAQKVLDAINNITIGEFNE